MRVYILLGLTFLFNGRIIAQNIGIGTNNPTRARIEVVGVSGVGNTSAIFGSDGAGISLQTNWPTIGFNQYRDQPSLYGKYMSSGYSVIMYFDPGSGGFAIDNQSTGALNTNTVQGIRAITINNQGKVGILYASLDANSASLTVGRGLGADGTAVIAGRKHFSHFNYSTNEHTYLRSIADTTAIDVNTIPNGKILIGNGSTMVSFGAANDPTATITLPYLSWSDDNDRRGLGLTDDYGKKWSLTAWGSLDMALGYSDSTHSIGIFKGGFDPSSGVYTSYSDKQLKQNIAPMDPVMQKVKGLKPVSYQTTNDNPQQKRSIGFIAQDVKPLFPSLVHIVDDNARNGERHKDLHTLNYSSMNVIAIKAIQEQWRQIKDLQREQDQLLSELILLNSQLDELLIKGNR